MPKPIVGDAIPCLVTWLASLLGIKRIVYKYHKFAKLGFGTVPELFGPAFLSCGIRLALKALLNAIIPSVIYVYVEWS